MSSLFSIIIVLVAAFLGTWLGIKYVAIASNRQEKAILVLLVQEFTLLLKSATTCYEQLLKGGGSFSKLLEMSDPSTFTKLAEVTRSCEIIEAALNLKSDFHQILQYANRASEALLTKTFAEVSDDLNLAEQKSKEASSAQDLAVSFFIGDLTDKNGFARRNYKAYIENLRLILNHLQDLNSASGPIRLFTSLVPELRSETLSLNRFIAHRKSEINLLEEKLGLLREMEKLLHSKQSRRTS